MTTSAIKYPKEKAEIVYIYQCLKSISIYFGYCYLKLCFVHKHIKSIVSENCVTIIKEQFDFEKIIIIIIDLFFTSGVGFPLYPEILYFITMILQHIRIIVGEAGYEPGTSAPEVWCTTNHHISIELSHLQRAITSPMSHHIFNEPPHLQWATTSWENYNVFI